MNLIPAPGQRSRASIKADPTIPKVSVTPWATICSTKASELDMRVGTPSTLTQDEVPQGDERIMTKTRGALAGVLLEI